AFGEVKPKAVVRHKIILGHRNCMPEERLAVLPVPKLTLGEGRASEQSYHGCGRWAHRRLERSLSASPRVGEFCQAPTDNNKDTDRGNIAVAVGHGLVTHLHQADDRNERP